MTTEDKPHKANASDIERLIDQHTEVLYLYALMRLGDESQAEDLVQETFLAALQNWDTFSGASTHRTWLIGILRHKILDHFRRRRQTACLDNTAWKADHFSKRKHWKDKMLNWKGDPATLAENGEFWDVLRQCMHELPESMVHAFIMRELEGMTSAQICKHLQISETNLWVRLHRARLQLRRCLELNWFAGKD